MPTQEPLASGGGVGDGDGLGVGVAVGTAVGVAEAGGTMDGVAVGVIAGVGVGVGVGVGEADGEEVALAVATTIGAGVGDTSEGEGVAPAQLHAAMVKAIPSTNTIRGVRVTSEVAILRMDSASVYDRLGTRREHGLARLRGARTAC